MTEFTELGNFLDVPVRAYSSGMQLRLSFAIATALRPEILLLDEWLSVGDEAFRAKAGNDCQYDRVNTNFGAGQPFEGVDIKDGAIALFGWSIAEFERMAIARLSPPHTLSKTFSFCPLRVVPCD